MTNDRMLQAASVLRHEAAQLKRSYTHRGVWDSGSIGIDAKRDHDNWICLAEELEAEVRLALRIGA